jgi:acetyl esterase
MPNPVDLEPQAKAVADANANPPYVFELGPDQGRRTVDAVQSGPVNKLPVDIGDTTVPAAPLAGCRCGSCARSASAGRCR